MRNTDWLRLGAAALALALAGCGGSRSENASAGTESGGGEETASDAPKPNIDPCGLISTQEVAEITGDAVDQAVRKEDSCSYRGPNRGDDGVEILFYLNDGERQMRAWHNANGLLDGMSGEVAGMGGAGADAAAMMKKDKAAAPKIGDEAAWGMNTAIGVRKGPHFFQVTPPVMHEMGKRPGLPLLSTEEKRSVATRVAEKVASRLPG
jgi:hypothetical protein